MIIVKVMGGLGNQLFQYAFGQAIKEKYGCVVKYDLSYFEKIPEGDEPRKAFINRFLEQDNIATEAEVYNLTKNDSKKVYKILRKLGFYSYRTKYERSVDGINSLEDVTDQTYLVGYWQSEKFFLNVKDIILNTFDFQKLVDDANVRGLANRFQKEQSVSIHVRGGDYLLEKNQALFGGICTSEYYRKAFNYIKDCTDCAKFYLFTNDIEWTKKNIDLSYDEITIISEQLEHPEDWIEMYLMSKCHKNIIANSSYSWWAAWLNNYEDKLVLAPNKWNQNRENEKIFCDSWIRMD